MSCWKKRTLRTLSRLMRLAVMFAMQPEANFTRALAMSTVEVSTGTPIASTPTTSVPIDRQDDVQIVNHHVEDDVDVQAAIGEPAQPVDLDEPRRPQNRQRRLNRRVEPLACARRREPRPRQSASRASSSPPRSTRPSASRRARGRRARETAARPRDGRRSERRRRRRRPGNRRRAARGRRRARAPRCLPPPRALARPPDRPRRRAPHPASTAAAGRDAGRGGRRR